MDGREVVEAEIIGLPETVVGFEGPGKEFGRWAGRSGVVGFPPVPEGPLGLGAIGLPLRSHSTPDVGSLEELAPGGGSGNVAGVVL